MATAQAATDTEPRRSTQGHYDTEQFLWSLGASLAALATALAVVGLF